MKSWLFSCPSSCACGWWPSYPYHPILHPVFPWCSPESVSSSSSSSCWFIQVIHELSKHTFLMDTWVYAFLPFSWHLNTCLYSFAWSSHPASLHHTLCCDFICPLPCEKPKLLKALSHVEILPSAPALCCHGLNNVTLSCSNPPCCLIISWQSTPTKNWEPFGFLLWQNIHSVCCILRMLS